MESIFGPFYQLIAFSQIHFPVYSIIYQASQTEYDCTSCLLLSVIETNGEKYVKIKDDEWHCLFSKVKQLQISGVCAIVIFAERSNETMIVSAKSTPNRANWVSSAVLPVSALQDSCRKSPFISCLCLPVKTCPTFCISLQLCLLLVVAKGDFIHTHTLHNV